MSNKFVEIDRNQFCNALEAKGFTPDPEAYGELVYVRQHHVDPTMFVKIYTSMPIHSGDTRAKGTDAIRVMLIFKNAYRSGCLHKTTRVNRAGSAKAVIDRTFDRAREAYAVANKRLKEK